MDRFGEWRPIEPAPSEGEAKPPPTERVGKAGSADHRFVGVLAAGVLLIVGGYIWLTASSPTTGVTLSVDAARFDTSLRLPPASGLASTQANPSPGTVVVDVEGAVLSPGLQRVAAGSRVGDAIAAAGGYSTLVDIAAAATSLNLAQPLTDGMKVHVPARGETAATQEPIVGEQPGTALPVAGAVINVNTATTEQLDTLPGIGPVTAAKIIAARETTPFATVDDLLARAVVGQATFEKIKALVSVGP